MVQELSYSLVIGNYKTEAQAQWADVMSLSHLESLQIQEFRKMSQERRDQRDATLRWILTIWLEGYGDKAGDTAMD